MAVVMTMIPFCWPTNAAVVILGVFGETDRTMGCDAGHYVDPAAAGFDFKYDEHATPCRAGRHHHRLASRRFLRELNLVNKHIHTINDRRRRSRVCRYCMTITI